MIRLAREEITHIVTHAGCPDGAASAIVAHKAFPEARVSFVHYGRPSLNEIPAEQGMLFADMTPPRERLAEFAQVSPVVLDHHETQRDIVEALGGVFGENDKLECGAALVYEHCGHLLGEEDRRLFSDFVYLAAVRDTWDRASPSWERACAQASVLATVPTPDLWDMPSVQLVDFINTLGGALRAAHLGKVKSSTSGGWRDNWRGVEHIIIQGVDIISDATDYVADDVELVVGFLHHDGQLKFSLRSRLDFDCADFAKHHGGGGHKAAAGFSVAWTGVGPTECFRHALDVYLDSKEG